MFSNRSQMQNNHIAVHELDYERKVNNIECTEMNEHISERFSTRHTTQTYEPPPIPFTSPPSQQARFSTQIRQYFETPSQPLTGGAWLTRSEVPTSAEILDIPDESQNIISENGDTPLQVNKILGPYGSTEEYLSSQYNLLREDAIKPLREAVRQIRADPFNLPESGYGNKVGIYEQVSKLRFQSGHLLTSARSISAQ